MKKLLTSIVTALFVLPNIALAYSPPCSRGDFYVRGDCLERGLAKAIQPLSSVTRKIARQKNVETRRTRQKNNTRKIYQGPSPTRIADSPLITHGTRKFTPPEQREVEINRRYIKSGAAGNSPNITRQDVSPRARLSRRERKAETKRGNLERKSFLKGRAKREQR